MLKRANSLLLNAALAVTLLAGAVAVAAGSGIIVTERPPGGPAAVERPTPRIEVRGTVEGLFPGARKQMKVRVRNRLPQRVKLVSVRARVQDAGPNCTRENVGVKRYRGSTGLPAHSHVQVRVKVKMKADVADPCQGARFPIKFRERVTGKRP